MTTRPDNPFASLERLRDRLSAGESRAHIADTPAPRGPARAVVRLERKQRRGKEVTVIEKLGLAPAELATWCRELKHALGCGGAVEGDAIMLQGDLRQRVPAVLTARGVQRISVS